MCAGLDTAGGGGERRDAAGSVTRPADTGRGRGGGVGGGGARGPSNATWGRRGPLEREQGPLGGSVGDRACGA